MTQPILVVLQKLVETSNRILTLRGDLRGKFVTNSEIGLGSEQPYLRDNCGGCLYSGGMWAESDRRRITEEAFREPGIYMQVSLERQDCSEELLWMAWCGQLAWNNQMASLARWADIGQLVCNSLMSFSYLA